LSFIKRWQRLKTDLIIEQAFLLDYRK